MRLRLWKSTQRYSELSFFLTDKTSALCRDKIGQMKLILRFSLMNSLRAFCSDVKREYIGPTGGWAPFRLILRLYGWWGVRTLALVLLKILVNLWYLEETLERSGASASFAKLAWISKEWR